MSSLLARMQTEYAFSMSSRDRPIVAIASMKHGGHHRGPAAEDHILLGSDDTVYSCGLKEAQLQVALQPGVRDHLERLPGAGVRVPHRERKVHVPVGGPDSLANTWASNAAAGTGFGESVTEAQAKLALDPSVRADAERVAVAGRRVEPRWLGASIRTSRPVGGAETLALGWAPAPAASAAPSAGEDRYSNGGGLPPSASAPAARAPESVRVLRPQQPVGGRSGVYLEAAAAAAAAAGPVASRRASVAGMSGALNSSFTSAGMSGVMSWGAEPLPTRPATAGGIESFLGSPRLRKEQPLGGRAGNAAGVDLSGVGARSSARAPLTP